jgi:methyl-accepting chemotaxis protein
MEIREKDRSLYLPILGIFILPVFANVGLRVFIDGLEGVLFLLSSPLIYSFVFLYSSGMLYLHYRNRCFMKKYSPEMKGEELEQFQKKFVKYPSLPLLATVLYGLLSGTLIAWVKGDFFSYFTEEMLYCFSLAMLFGMPTYILFIRGYEKQNGHLPFSEKYLSISLKIRFLLVIVLCMVSLFGVSLVGTKFIILHNSEIGGGEILYNHIRMRQGVIFLVCASMAVINVVMMLNGILERIGEARSHLSSMSEGDFSSHNISLSSRDELGCLLYDLSRVRYNVASLLGSIRASSGQTVEIQEQLTSASEQTSSAMTEMNGNMDSIARSARELDKNINIVSQSMDKLGEGVGAMDRGIDSQGQLQEQSSAAVTEMAANIESIADIAHSRITSAEDLNREALEGRTVIEETITGIQEIDSSVDNIKAITQVILSIASRTNLLAMNAAIEAAHAGEAGRGFSVVAEEIRKLAETSSVNSKQINDIIKDIVGKIEEAARRGGRTQTSFDSLTKGIGEVTNSLMEIEASVSELKTGSGEIISAMTDLEDNSHLLRRLSQAMTEERVAVNSSLEGVLQISAHNQSAMGEMGIGAREVLETALALSGEARRLNDAAEELEKNVGQFTIVAE